MPKRLSQQEIERYRREGFVLPVRVLIADVVKIAAAGIERMLTIRWRT